MTTSILDTMRTFFEQYSPSRYNKGQVFLLQGEKSDYVYYLEIGRVKVYSVSYRGDEVILFVHRPPDFFPVSHAIGQTHNNYIYEADSETVVRRAPVYELMKLLETQPSVTLDLLRHSYGYIDEFLERQLLLMAGNARSLVMHELLSLSYQEHVQEVDGRCVIDVSERELASRTGLSRETINREIKKLKKEKILIIRRRQIVIVNLDRLESGAHRDI